MSPATKTLVLAAGVLTAIAWVRPPEYDEAYSIFLTAGHARPGWPAGVFTAGGVRGLYAGHASFGGIARNLRGGDVHPPLYFWLLDIWRGVFGPGWFTARLLSVGCAVAALAVLGRLARVIGAPAGATMWLCLCSYGFAYTAVIARGFGLAQLFLLVGVTACFESLRGARGGISPAVAGLALGAATFTNYLTVFCGLTALGHVTLTAPKRGIAALLAFSLFLPADGYFFMAQHAARPGQFVAFSVPRAVALTAKDSGAAWFGGLPVYAPRFAGEIIFLLILLAGAAIFCIVRHANPSTKPLLALTLATPVGLLALGLICNNTPVEIRYMAFSLPYLSLLVAASAPKALRAALIGVQALAIIGLAFSPATAQPQARAARQAAALEAPQTLVLLPFGNDGVGIPGPFIAAAPAAMRLELLRGPPLSFATESRLILVTLTLDKSSRAQVAGFQPGPCWQAGAKTPVTRIFLNGCPHQQP
jgi:hypothetical protein